jgi:sec-independent protein translocase protein TatC
MSQQDPAQDPSLEPEAEGREAAAPVPAASSSDPEPTAGEGSDDPSLDPIPGPEGEASLPTPAGESAPAESAPAGGGGDGGDVEGEEADENDLPEMGLLDHLNDLRKRLSRSAVAVLIGFLACYGYAEEIFNFLLVPLRPYLPKGSGLIFTNPPEAFFTYMLAAAVAGFFLVSPYVFYQIWQFVAPGLYKHERKWIIPIAFCSALCFIMGAAFAYLVVFPYAFQFFMSYARDIIQAQLKMEEYFSFTLKLLIAFGICFELPLFVFFLARLGMVTSKGLRKVRQYAILVIFIISAILTPPDVISQLAMAGPLCVLYEISIWVAHFFSTKKEPEPEETQEPESAPEEKAG